MQKVLFTSFFMTDEFMWRFDEWKLLGYTSSVSWNRQPVDHVTFFERGHPSLGRGIPKVPEGHSTPEGGNSKMAWTQRSLRWNGISNTIEKWAFMDVSGNNDILRSLSNNDRQGYENVTYKVNLRCWKLYCAYFTSFNSSNDGKFFCSWILKDCIKVQEKKKKVIVLRSRTPQNVKLKRFTS